MQIGRHAGRQVGGQAGNRETERGRGSGTTGHQVIAEGAKEEFLRSSAAGATLTAQLAQTRGVLGSPQRSHNGLINIKLDPERR